MRNSINKFKFWLGTAAGKISIWLFMISIIMILMGIILTFVYGEFTVYNILVVLLFGLATNIMSIIVTVTFVQDQWDKQDIKKEQKEETKKIKRFNRVFENYINQYCVYYYCVTVPIEQRKPAIKNVNTLLNTNFKFMDLKDLHDITTYEQDGLTKSSIVLFFEAENDIVIYAKRMIEEIDFKYHKELFGILCNFINSSVQTNIKNAILCTENMCTTDKDGKNTKQTKNIHEWIKEDEKYNWVDKMEQDRHANVMGPYVALYNLLQVEGDLINQYQKYMSKIISE